MVRALVLSAAVLLAACASPLPVRLDDPAASDARWVPPSKADPAKERLGLQDVLALVQALHPSLAAARAGIDAADAEAWEARVRPAPVLGLEVEEFRSGESKRTIGLTLPFSLTGRLGAAGRAGDARAGVAAMDYLVLRRELLAAAKKAWIDAIAAREAEELARRAAATALELREAAKARVETGAAPELELLRARVVVAKAESDLRLAVQSRAATLEALRSAIGATELPFREVEGALAGTLKLPSCEVLAGLMAGSHPSLQAALLGRKAADADAEAAAAERTPDLELRIAVGRNAEEEGILEAGIEIPLPGFGAGKGRAAAAEARARAARFQVDVVRLDLEARLSAARRETAAALERAATLEGELLPAAEQAAAQAEEAWKAGRLGLLDVLDARRTLEEARSARAAAVAELNRAAVDVEQLAGIPLD